MVSLNGKVGAVVQGLVGHDEDFCFNCMRQEPGTGSEQSRGGTI